MNYYEKLMVWVDIWIDKKKMLSLSFFEKMSSSVAVPILREEGREVHLLQ